MRISDWSSDVCSSDLYLQPRLGSGIPYSVPRGTWRCRDGAWVAVSTSAESVAARVMGLIGFGDRADLATFAGRIAARDEIDARMAARCGARPLAEVLDRSAETTSELHSLLRISYAGFCFEKKN